MTDDTTDTTDTVEPQPEQPEHDNTDRRSVVKATLLAAAASIVGFGAGASTTAAQEPSGDVGTAATPFDRAHVNIMSFVARTSDPSDPDDGTMWYNEEA